MKPNMRRHAMKPNSSRYMVNKVHIDLNICLPIYKAPKVSNKHIHILTCAYICRHKR